MLRVGKRVRRQALAHWRWRGALVQAFWKAISWKIQKTWKGTSIQMSLYFWDIPRLLSFSKSSWLFSSWLLPHGLERPVWVSFFATELRPGLLFLQSLVPCFSEHPSYVIALRSSSLWILRLQNVPRCSCMFIFMDQIWDYFVSAPCHPSPN